MLKETFTCEDYTGKGVACQSRKNPNYKGRFFLVLHMKITKSNPALYSKSVSQRVQEGVLGKKVGGLFKFYKLFLGGGTYRTNIRPDPI